MAAELITYALFGTSLLIGLGFIVRGIPHSKKLHNDDNISGEWLGEYLDKAKKEILIVANELKYEIYNPYVDKIRARLKENPKLRIHIIMGPKFHVPPGAENKFLTLLRTEEFKGRLKIDYLTANPRQHFRIIDSRYVYIEIPHAPHQEDRMIYTINHSFFKSWQYREAFYELLMFPKKLEPEIISNY